MKVHLLDIGKTIAIKEFQKKNNFKVVFKEPLVLRTGEKKFIVLLRYGVVAFWDLSKAEEKKWLERIDQYIVDPFDNPHEDSVTVGRSSKREGIFRGNILLKSFEVPKIALISLILGRSLALERYETEASKALGEFDSVMKSFGEKGETSLSTKALLKIVGFAMNLQHTTVSQMALLDKPDLTWEEPALDRLYNDLATDYELEDRYDILNEKLKLIFHNVEFILDFLDARKSYTLELVVVLLIFLEIVLFVFELWK